MSGEIRPPVPVLSEDPARYNFNLQRLRQHSTFQELQQLGLFSIIKMGRLNYTNRKIEGLKLGQVVAKDLLKRIPPGSGHKAALRDPYVEIDVSGRALTDEGFLEAADAIKASVAFDDKYGKVVILEELGLKGNQLSAGCLTSLSRVVAFAANDLRDIDLSDNIIKITTNEETAAWEIFLESFSRCSVLRRVDFSGNPLGPRAFEVLARVYGKEQPVELLSLSDAKLNHDDSTFGLTSTVDEITNMEQTVRKMSIVLGDVMSDMEAAPAATSHRRKGSRQDANPQAAANTPERPFHFYTSTRGLRSVPYIILGNTSMTETCALHLSYLLVRHHFPEQLIMRVPPAKAGPSQQQLEAYDTSSGCQGIVYLPNDKLGNAGSKVLELSELAREGILDEASQDETSEEFKTPSKSASALRRASDVRHSPLITATSGRRRSTTSASSSEQCGRSAGSNTTTSSELDRARSRIQGNVLRDAGAYSVDLWRVSLKMLTLSRAILLPAAEKIRSEDARQSEPLQFVQPLPPVQPVQPVQLVHPVQPAQPIWPGLQQETADNDFPPLPSYTARVVMAPPPHPESVPLTAGDPNQPVTPKRVHRRKKSANPNTYPPAPEALTKTNIDGLTSDAALFEPEQQPYRSRLPYGFSEDVWRQIISHQAGVHGILNITQQRSILRWAMDRATLNREREALGKPESAQIWRLLEGIGCLAYDVKD